MSQIAIPLSIGFVGFVDLSDLTMRGARGDYCVMRLLSGSALLNDQQKRFVFLVSKRGLSFDAAALEAGYSEQYGYELRKNPAIAAALHESIQLDLQTDLAPLAYRVAKTLLGDEDVSARVRADLSMKVLDRAGHITPSRKENAPQKALSEMTQSELLAFIERNQAEIDKAEGELASQAKDVSAPAIAPVSPVLDAKTLEYLD
jgi:hypothetical protein